MKEANFSRLIFGKSSIIFYETLYNGSRVVPCEQTDRQTEDREKDRQAGRQTDMTKLPVVFFFIFRICQKKKLTGNRLRSENLDSNFCTRLIGKGLCMSSV